MREKVLTPTTYAYYCHQIISCTKDITQLILKPASEKKLCFIPGQYIEVVLSTGRLLPLSIANTPREDGQLEIHLRHNTTHTLAEKFLAEIALKKPIHLYGPKGSCTLDRASSQKDLLFLAGGTGYAPIKALLKAALYHHNQTIKLYLYWGICRPQDAYDEQQLYQWQQAFPQFCHTLVLSEPQLFPHWQGATGLVHNYAAKQHPDFSGLSVFASGPFPMVTAASALFMQQGLSLKNFISDMLNT